jgi:hypothetical protein
MASVARSVRRRRQLEDWKALPWKNIQRSVFRLQQRIYQAERRNPRQTVLMTTALVPKSGVTGNCYAPFGSGGEGSDPLTDHDLGAVFTHKATTVKILSTPPESVLPWLISGWSSGRVPRPVDRKGNVSSEQQYQRSVQLAYQPTAPFQHAGSRRV